MKKLGCAKCGGAMKKMAAGGSATTLKDIINRNFPLSGTTGPIMMKKGGSTKNAKLAGMAAPKGKVTRADIITAIKKKAKKK